MQELDIKVGETKKYQIKAPEGNYAVVVYDGKDQYDLGNQYLSENSSRKMISFISGAAIQLKDLDSLSDSSNINLLIWLVIILVLIKISN